MLFILPWIKIGGNPLIRVDILGREFYLMGIHFTPQDFHLFVVAMLTMVVFIALFTVVFGRLFCGWVCPQTIFMEMVFRQIEYLVEGDANAQRKLNAQSWTPEKFVKKSLNKGFLS
ncbi:MAG: 4Fe-4S binding protein [Saprospiraceae bacterium]